jgi:hypothetical protein
VAPFHFAGQEVKDQKGQAFAQGHTVGQQRRQDLKFHSIANNNNHGAIIIVIITLFMECSLWVRSYI